jgi:hypothetical protein
VVYEKGVGRTLEGYQGDATIEEKDNRQRADGESHPSKKTGLTRLLGIVLLVAAVLFWVAALGREVFGRYSRCLDPRAWLGNKQR